MNWFSNFRNVMSYSLFPEQRLHRLFCNTTTSIHGVYLPLYWPCRIPSCLWVWWRGRPWLTVAEETQTRKWGLTSKPNKYAQSSTALRRPRSSGSKIGQNITEAGNMSTAAKSLWVSPWRRGSRSWSAPLWAASWCRRSSSSPPAGSSGCHCRLRHLTLAPACSCPESTKLLLLFLHSRAGAREPRSADPPLTSSSCRSRCRGLKEKIHKGGGLVSEVNLQIFCRSVLWWTRALIRATESKASHSLPTRLAREESRSSDTSFSGCWPDGWLEPARVGLRIPPAISDETQR